jgi:hypothetical protein
MIIVGLSLEKKDYPIRFQIIYNNIKITILSIIYYDRGVYILLVNYLIAINIFQRNYNLLLTGGDIHIHNTDLDNGHLIYHSEPLFFLLNLY